MSTSPELLDIGTCLINMKDPLGTHVRCRVESPNMVGVAGGR